MTVNDILLFNAQIIFVILSVFAIVDYLRRPNPRRRDFALLCLSLGIPLGITLLQEITGSDLGILPLLGAIALFAQPYFLFRLVQYYRTTPRWTHWAVLVGMVLCSVILFTYIGVYPLTTQAIIFGYTVVVDGYCTWEYSRGRATTGTLQHRLLLITISAGLFTLALFGNVIKAIWPNIGSGLSALGLAVTALSAVLYYLAFIPPRWLRYAWHYEDLRDFLATTKITDASNMRLMESFNTLATTADQAVNGVLGAVIRWNADESRWTTLGTTDAAISAEVLANEPPFLKQTWQQRNPIALYLPEVADADVRRQMSRIGAHTWLIVPITTTEQIGVLLVLLRERSLFTDDDLTLLELFTQQSAILQENNRLITTLQLYSEELERKVEERTKDLLESEAALRELNATLEQSVKERTSELQRSNEELDNFAYVASHDLKAPLRAINHLADWIEQDSGDLLPAKSREHLSKLQGRVNRMETLLNDLLAYSRVGRQRHPQETVTFNELIHEVTEVISPPTGFTVKTFGDMVMDVERTPLETVFRNLVGNSIKHHHQPEQGCVEVYADQQDAMMKFVVRDDGPGIAPEFHQRIFEIFTTLNPRDQVEGSGIGLAIVKKSIESRGGSIWLESAEGEGTTVHFTWPLNSQPADP